MLVVRTRESDDGYKFYKLYSLKPGVDASVFFAENPQFRKVESEKPDMDTLEEWLFDGVCESTDGCMVEPDGICPHGHPSWLLVLGLI
jgi:hypothetical protein